MQIRTLVPFFAICALAGGIAPVRAQSDAKNAISSAYAAIDKAYATKNTAGVFAHYAPDYTSITKSGKKETLEQVKGQMDSFIKIVQSLKVTTTLQSLTPKGDTAVALVKVHVVATAINPQTKKPSTLVIDQTSSDTWAKSGGKWLQKVNKEIATKTMVDGKPQN